MAMKLSAEFQSMSVGSTGGAAPPPPPSYAAASSTPPPPTYPSGTGGAPPGGVSSGSGANVVYGQPVTGPPMTAGYSQVGQSSTLPYNPAQQGYQQQQQQAPPSYYPVSVPGTGNSVPVYSNSGQPQQQQPQQSAQYVQSYVGQPQPGAMAPSASSGYNQSGYVSSGGQVWAPSSQAAKPAYHYGDSTSLSAAGPPAPYAYGGAPYQAGTLPPGSNPAPVAQYPQLGGIQYASSGQPGAAVTPGPAASQSVEEKARRITEMGFPYQNALQALSMHNGNEESAINYLLGGGGPPPAQGAPNLAAPPQTQVEPKKKGWW